MSFSTLLHISRPRFWHYVLWPMLIYFASSGLLDEIYASWSRWGTDWIFHLIILIIILGYFTLPANLWIYGRNDIADGDTDKFNSKKWTYETKIEDTKIMKNKLKWNIWWWNIGYIVIWYFLATTLAMSMDCFPRESSGYICEEIIQAPWKVLQISVLFFFNIHLRFILWYLIVFLLSSYLYSCKPLRAKAKPFIDGIMNILYIAVPFSIIALSIASSYYYGQHPTYNLSITISLFCAALFRCMAMHCYSAIPDIEPDKQAGLTTTAIYLGKQNSLIYCSVLYTLSALLSFPALWWFSIWWGVLYLAVMILSYYKKDIFALYKLFPSINLIIWFLLFRYIILYL